jgi:hypothetical protein
MAISIEDMENIRNLASRLTKIREEAEELGLAETVIEALIEAESTLDDNVQYWGENLPE